MAEDKFAAMLQSCASKSHGTRARYRSGCHCMLCRAANSRYETDRDAARREGDTRGIVLAAAARAHILDLGERGVGYKAVAEASRVSKTIVFQIRQGKRLKIRQSTERAILAVTEEARGDASLIDAAPTWTLINELLAEGYTKVQLAHWLGYAHALQFKKKLITARSASRVERIYRLVRDGRLMRDRAALPAKRLRRADAAV